MNRAFITLRFFFKLLFQSLKHNGTDWRMLLINNNEFDKLAFSILFGIRYDPNLREKILTTEEFIETVNRFLIEMEFESFSITSDGIFRYFGTTVESEIKKKAYDLLSSRMYDNVIINLDDIDDHILNNKFPDALASCRKCLESFYKRLLLNHNIKILHDGKNTEDGLITNLAQTVKNEISKLFVFPSYSINIDTQGFPHLIESSKFIISGMANPGGSHGKSIPPKIKLNEIRIAEYYLLMLINILLQFEK